MLEIVSKPGDYLMASYLEDAQSQVYQYDWNGKLIRKVELPAIGSAGGFSGKKGETEAFYSLTNFTTPSTVYRYDLATGESTLYKRPEVKFNPEDYTTEQVFYTSKDGTKVPMFIVYRNGLKLDGNNPCYLYAYGGFQVSLAPWFNPAAIMFMEQGGVYCVANLRGGLEYGEEWHKGGMLDKNRTFSMISSQRPNTSLPTNIPRRRNSPSRAVRTAACWWVPAKCSVPTCSASACRRSA